MDFLYFYTEIQLWTISSSRILEIKDILCEKEPMPRNNEVYGSFYVEHHLNNGIFLWRGTQTSSCVLVMNYQWLLKVVLKGKRA